MIHLFYQLMYHIARQRQKETYQYEIVGLQSTSQESNTKIEQNQKLLPPNKVGWIPRAPYLGSSHLLSSLFLVSTSQEKVSQIKTLQVRCYII